MAFVTTSSASVGWEYLLLSFSFFLGGGGGGGDYFTSTVLSLHTAKISVDFTVK